MSTAISELTGPSIARQFERLPPHSVEAEMCLLASVMLDAEAFEECKPLVDREMFYLADHQIIWDVVAEQYRAGRPVDAILVRAELIRRQLLDEVGGIGYLAAILDSVPSAAHGMHYAKVVVGKSKLRQLISASNDILRDAYAPMHDESDIDAIARRMEDAAVAVRECGFTENIVALEQIADAVLDSKLAGNVSRLKFGLTDLDDLTGGAPIGGLTYFGGRAGMGKSQALKQVLHNLSRGVVDGTPGAAEAVPVGLVSIEESRQKIGENMLANVSGVENSRIVYNRLNADDWNRLAAGQTKLKDQPFYVDDGQVRLSGIEATIRRMVRKYGCRAIGVDHLHLIDGERHDGNREQEITHISRTLKSLFKSLGVVGIVALQMNRGGGGEDFEAAPDLRHLRGSGSLEQDGDLIVQLHREDYYRWKRDGNSFAPDHKLVAYVNKNKGGPVGSRELYFDGDTQSVTDWNDGRGSRAPDSLYQL